MIAPRLPTPPSSAFHHTIKPSNYPFVFMGEINENHYNNDILSRYNGIRKSGNKSSLFHYKTYDWVSPNYYVELKSRNNDFDYYSTTMIGYNKVAEWEKDTTDKKYYFLFGFLDGLFEWELTKENYDEIGGYDCVRPAGTQYVKDATYTTFNKNKLHLYIPVKKLKKISDKGCLVPDELVSKSLRNIMSGVCLIKF
jgi:hypothetical protein